MTDKLKSEDSAALPSRCPTCLYTRGVSDFYDCSDPWHTTCEKCGKPKFGPTSTIASGSAHLVQSFYCGCMEVFNGVALPSQQQIKHEPNSHPQDGGPKEIAWEESVPALILVCSKCRGTLIYKRVGEIIEVYHSCNVGSSSKSVALPSSPAPAFNQGRLFQFQRMKKERPIDPTYWDMHEERELKELAGTAQTATPSPTRGAYDIAVDIIDLFLEYRDKYLKPEIEAKHCAATEYEESEDLTA